jgi:hypothetical protein
MTIAARITGGARRVMAGIAIVSAVTAALFVSAPAAQAATTYKVTATLEARDLEDNFWGWWDDKDEISVNFNGVKVFGATQMKLNQPQPIATGRQFADFLRITVYEWDGGSARNLGEQYVSTSSLGTEQHLQFGVSNSNGYEYILKYTISAA